PARGASDLGAWLPSAATAGMPMPDTDGDEPAVAFAPGLAAYRESTLIKHATATAEALGLADGDLVVSPRPATHRIAWSFALATLAGGATYLFDPRLDESTLPAELARFSAMHLVADETTALRLAKAWHADGSGGSDGSPEPPDAATGGNPLPSLRWAGIVNATSADAAQSLDELGIPARGLYAPAGILAPFALWPADRSTADRWLGGGTPICSDVELRVTDPDASSGTADTTTDPGTGTDPGTTAGAASGDRRGVLEIRGACVPDSATGWFRTGDLASVTDDGDVRYEGPAHHRARPAASSTVDDVPRRTKLLIGLVCLAGLVVAALLLPVPSPAELRAWADDAGAGAAWLFLLAYAVCTIAPIPRTVFNLAAGLLLGE